MKCLYQSGLPGPQRSDFYKDLTWDEHQKILYAISDERKLLIQEVDELDNQLGLSFLNSRLYPMQDYIYALESITSIQPSNSSCQFALSVKHNPVSNHSKIINLYRLGFTSSKKVRKRRDLTGDTRSHMSSPTQKRYVPRFA